jgi:ribose transport system substrate-binding protein
MNTRKLLSISIALAIAVMVFAFWQNPTGSIVGAEASTTPAESNSTADGEKMEVVIISKSFNNQFYQATFKGAQDAADEFGVKLTTDGPDAESNISQQVDKFNAAINRKPAAIALAACDPASVEDALKKALEAGIPIIGFDSGVPGDPTGAVVATAATDNVNAGGNVADNLAEEESFKTRVLAATAKAPVVIGVLAQDVTSGSLSLRVDGFVNELKARIEAMDGMKGSVEIGGQQKWTVPAAGDTKVKILVTAPPTTSQSDIQTAATAMLQADNLIAVFGANQDGVNGFLSATRDGMELNRTSGKYKDLLVVGFDSGITQREAIKAGEFLGSVTQDPYMMGYEAVRLAVEAARGNAVADVDTGSKWYNKDNIDNEDIAVLLYD